MATQTDRIEKKIHLRAPRARVWRALSDAKEFGQWFGVRFDAPFEPGAALSGTHVPTAVDAEVAKMQEPMAGRKFDITVDRIEPQRLFSFRWHPFAIEEGVDYSNEPTTLVTFEIEDAEGGVLLKVTESGFDEIPLERRAKAFAANEGGWGIMIHVIEKYVGQHAA